MNMMIPIDILVTEAVCLSYTKKEKKNPTKKSVFGFLHLLPLMNLNKHNRH